jgi:hypothetical protein
MSTGCSITGGDTKRAKNIVWSNDAKSLASKHRGNRMRKSIASTTLTLVFAANLAATGPVRAEESMQVSGTDWITQVESHFIPDADGSGRASGIEKYVGAVSSPGWFDSMQGTFVSAIRSDLKLGQAEAKGTLFWRNSEGSLSGSYVVKVTLTMDQKTNLSKGTIEGTWEIVSGTGHFESVRGHGAVKGEFGGGDETDQFNGTITGFEKRASTK